jgi:hypothetical protein
LFDGVGGVETEGLEVVEVGGFFHVLEFKVHHGFRKRSRRVDRVIVGDKIWKDESGSKLLEQMVC